MNKVERQNALDVQKWIDSEQKGYDCCGSYDYCSKCDKQVEYPCAVAYDAFNAKQVKAKKKPAAKKPAAKKAEKKVEAKVEAKVEVKPEVKAEEKKPVAKKSTKKASK